MKVMIKYIINKARNISLPSIIGRGWGWVFLFLFSFSSVAAQEKIVNPDITYAGSHVLARLPDWPCQEWKAMRIMC